MLRKMGLVLLVVLALGVIASASLAQDEFSLTVMHTNDQHAAHTPNGAGNGGAARLAAVVNQIRAEAPNNLLLDAGDRFTGTLFHTVYLGQDQVQVMNLLGYDAMTLGNHEFDGQKDNPAILNDFINGITFPAVTANVDFSATPELDEKIAPYTTIEVDGQQIGIIGLTTPDSTVTSTPAADISFDSDLAGTANAAAAELIAAGVNKIILLTHIGIQADQELIPQLSGIDVVLGGHSHTLLSSTYSAAADSYPLQIEDADGNVVYYGQAGANGLYLGRMDLTFDAEGAITRAAGDTILLSRYITPDVAMQTLIDNLSGPVDELGNQSINATTDVLLVGDRLVCRVEECNLGNVIADGLRAETGAQIAIMNAGGIRADIEAGEITLGEVLTVQPFGNTVATLSLTGADVIAALENGVSRIVVENGLVVRQGANGRFPQVSGIRYSYDPTQEAGSRIVSVEVQAEDGSFSPIDPAATYTIATNSFARQGGDGYTMMDENAINPYDFGRVDYESLVDYLVANSPITAEVEGRITIVNATVAPMP
jgi:5'-nucleotidase